MQIVKYTDFYVQLVVDIDWDISQCNSQAILAIGLQCKSCSGWYSVAKVPVQCGKFVGVSRKSIPTLSPLFALSEVWYLALGRQNMFVSIRSARAPSESKISVSMFILLSDFYSTLIDTS